MNKEKYVEKINPGGASVKVEVRDKEGKVIEREEKSG